MCGVYRYFSFQVLKQIQLKNEVQMQSILLSSDCSLGVLVSLPLSFFFFPKRMLALVAGVYLLKDL